jgi:hypothetical protein
MVRVRVVLRDVGNGSGNFLRFLLLLVDLLLVLVRDWRVRRWRGLSKAHVGREQPGKLFLLHVCFFFFLSSSVDTD